MRIGMVIDTFLPMVGGAELHVLELGRALREKGNDVSVFTAVPGPDTVDGFAVTRVTELGQGRARGVLLSPSACPRMASFVRDVDVVHCHYTYLLGVMAMTAAKFLRKPCLTTLHGLGTLDSSVGRSRILRLYRGASFRLADRIIATSQEMAEVARRFVKPARISVISNGVNTTFFDPGAVDNGVDHDGPVVLALRRLAPKNGVQYLVEAAPLVVERVPDVEFWISGREKLEGYLRERVRELGVEESFRFLGEVPAHQTRDYFARADVVVFPSSAESTSLACLEAMSMERAVVASALSAYREMLGDSERGVLVKLFDRDWSDYNAPLQLAPERIKCLADAIVELCLDRDRRQRLGARARAHVCQEYDWGIIGDRVQRLYESLVDDGNGRRVRERTASTTIG